MALRDGCIELKEEEYKDWLEKGGATAKNARNTRTYAVRTIEGNLAELGMPHRDLEEAWEADRFSSLVLRLKKMRDDAGSGGQDYRILMPHSEKPQGRLRSWISWLGQYGRFLSGEVPSGRKDADRIRQYVLDEYIAPARDDGRDQVDVLVSDVNTALSLNQGWANICQALEGPKFQELAEVPPPQSIGAERSPATIFRFNVDAELTEGKDRPFALFDSSGAVYQPVRSRNSITGMVAFRIQPRGAGNKTEAATETNEISDVAQAMLVNGLASRVKANSGGPSNYLTYGGKLVRYELDPVIAQEIGVPPNGSLTGTTDQIETVAQSGQQKQAMHPMNLILYGPPGTGKTYTTAAEAVRLCGEPLPEDRRELMAVYQRLSEAGRIAFVTFHQSMAYEEFVEGRQPMTGPEEGEDQSSTGFRLEAVPGIFRRIAKRAETSWGRSSSERAVRVDGRRVFKMSIGEASNPEDAHLFEEAIAGGYALLGFENIDWTDEKYASREAMIAACKAQGDHYSAVDARSGVVQMPFIFRNSVRQGDIVIVSKGNGLFRAIGVFTGDYEFSPRPEGVYGHRRAVEWLWVERDGLPVSEVYSRGFSQKSIYELSESELNLPALERYMNSQLTVGEADPEPFVLIIDEINRANISKVFGELITLLEGDKRLGQPNQLKVRLPYSGDEFGVPSNLHIIGTMNTADRSIALLDTALRRRFTFRELMPNSKTLTDAAARTGVDLPLLLTTINERIEYLHDREHQIGHAYFMDCFSLADVNDAMRHKVIPLLAEYFFEDWSKIAAVLGDLENHEGPINGGFLKRSVLKAPPGLENDEAMPSFRWSMRSVDEGFDYTNLLDL